MYSTLYGVAIFCDLCLLLLGHAGENVEENAKKAVNASIGCSYGIMKEGSARKVEGEIKKGERN